MKTRAWGAVLVAACLLAVPAAAQNDSDTVIPRNGGFKVMSGDSVRFGKRTLRLFGIEAPAKGQTCDDGAWQPAPLATQALTDFIAGRPVACYQVETDKAKRPVVQCFVGEDDIQAYMVTSGWAWAVPQKKDRYVEDQRDAEKRKVGVHAHRCELPWVWRAKNPPAQQANRPR